MQLPQIRQPTWVALFVLLLCCLLAVLAIVQVTDADGPTAADYPDVTPIVELGGPRLSGDGPAEPGTTVTGGDVTVPVDGQATIALALPPGCPGCHRQVADLPDLDDRTAGVVVSSTAPGTLPAGWRWLTDDPLGRARTHLGGIDEIHWTVFDGQGAVVGTAEGPLTAGQVTDTAAAVHTVPAPPLPTQ